MTLTRFRWVFCQLETLRHCLPQSVRRTLNELPESLDETYERVMMEIKKSNQVHAYRMLQCLTAANRPLYVAELAEILAFDFDVANGGIPKLNSDWRWGDHEQAVLSTCSSLITVVPGRGSPILAPIVQFSHFSVKEFLMSDRLATSTRDISQYHISLEDAHTVLTQACLGVLLRVPDFKNRADRGPLTRYAAEQWVAHAQIENVASRVRDGMEYLFDPDKPYFEAWVWLHDVDEDTSDHTPETVSGARPLYYAALCGFHELVQHLIFKYPQYASARGGRLGTALHSASFAGHLQIVRSLLRHGVGVDVRAHRNCTPLRYASMSGHHDVVQCLLDYGADVDSQEDDHSTPLHWPAYRGHVDVIRVLLEHNADVNAKDEGGWTPLHDATSGSDSKGDYAQVVRLLLEHGANANARDAKHRTPLHLVLKLDVARILLEHGASVDTVDEDGKTPWRVAVEKGKVEIVFLLSAYRFGRAHT
jgi:ankyrin repeat protein